MSPALPAWVPDRETAAGELLTATIVGATLYVLDRSLPFAAAAAALFLCLRLLTDAAAAAVGDYADNALFGLLVLAAAGYAAALTAPVWIPLSGALVGGWLFVDGVQHLRHGVGRDEVGHTVSHDGSVLAGLPRALLARLVEPFRL
ncbi:hypothetical protein [Haloarcula litorea]|uniref:hypothetical protein n=1 Tax=Haloarcula litorea TaxID=3032579 RepID=UPI0023E8762E|nr:hypothetical protein [Halomicroarcula sp. GDY20]